MNRTRRLCVALLVALLGSAVAPGASASEASPERGAALTGDLVLRGHGWGHGRGLGQYGARGWAVDFGWSAGRILDHYYGGTTPGDIGNPRITVEMTGSAGQPIVVAQERGGLLTSADTGGRAQRSAVRVERVGPSRWRVLDGPGCAGPWTARPSELVAPVVTFDSAFRRRSETSDDHRDLLQLCNSGGTRWVRGQLRAVDAAGTPRAVNRLRMQAYLRGVVPRESPASWGDLGDGRGMQALRAQSVAARSYAAAENRSSFAETCDTTSCQVYGGAATHPAGGGFARLEDPRTDRAIERTAGVVRVRDGAVARTEFSSSTGGWSAGGVFPAVWDLADATPSNPNHLWTARIPVATIEGAYGRGQLLGVKVIERNGLGDWGGRALQVRVTLTGGTVVVTGDQFRSTFGLRSNWFRVRR